MEKRCYHPENFNISWVVQQNKNFAVVGGKSQTPFHNGETMRPNLKFKCGDRGFTAYYNARNAPHWLEGKLDAAGAGFPIAI